MEHIGHQSWLKPKRKYTKRQKTHEEGEANDEKPKTIGRTNKEHTYKAYVKRRKLAGKLTREPEWKRQKGRWINPNESKTKITTYFKITEEKLDLRQLKAECQRIDEEKDEDNEDEITPTVKEGFAFSETSKATCNV